jgi:hypothetical protein
MSFLDEYKAQLDSIVAEKLAGTQNTGSSSMANAIALLRMQSTPMGKNYKASGGPGALGKAGGQVLSGGQKILDILSRPLYAVQNFEQSIMAQSNASADKGDIDPITGVGKTHLGPALHNAKLGFEGKKPETGSDVLKAAGWGEGDNGNKGRAAAGFAMDIINDPLTYVGVGPLIKAGKATFGSKGIEHALESSDKHALKNVLEEGAAPVEVNQAAKLLDENAPKAQELDKAPLPAEVVPDAIPAVQRSVDQSANIPLIAARAAVESANNELGKIPSLRYSPNTKIAPAYKTVEETVAEAPTPAAATKAPVKGVSPSRARGVAFYNHIMSNPRHEVPVTMGGRVTKVPVAKLQEIAKTSPEKAKMVRSLISQEAKRLMSESPEYFSDEPHVKLFGRGGKIGGSLSVNKMDELLQTGTVGRWAREMGREGPQAERYADDLRDVATTGEASPLQDFAIHTADDLANLHVVNEVGDLIPLTKMLKSMGVKVRQETFKFNDDILDNPPVAGVAKTVTSKVVSKASALSPEEKAKWIEAHKDILDEEDINKILKATFKTHNSVIAKILSKPGKTGFNNVDDLMEAIKDGRVSESDLAKLIKLTGAKSPTGIKRGLTKLLKNEAELESARITRLGPKEVAEQGDEFMSEAPKEPLPVKPAEEILDEVINKGDKTELVSKIDQLDPLQAADLQAGLKDLVQEQIVNARDLEKYGYKTNKGAARDSATPNKGKAIKPKEWNEQAQYNAVKAIVGRQASHINELVRKSGIQGESAIRTARSAAMYDHVMPISRTIDKVLRSVGIPPKLTKDSKYFASLTDMLDLFPREFVEKHFFDKYVKTVKGGKKIPMHEHIPPTMWNHIGETMMDFAKGNLNVNEAMDSISSLLLGGISFRNGTKLTSQVAGKAVNLANKRGEEIAGDYIHDIARTFLGKAQELAQQSERNVAEAVASNVNGAGKVSEATMQSIVKLVQSPTFVTNDILTIANETDAIAESIAKSLGVTSEVAKDLAKTDVKVQASSVIPPETVADAKAAKKAGRANNAGKSKTAVITGLKDAIDNAESGFLAGAEGETLRDIGQRVEGTFAYRFLRNFAPHFKNADVRPVWQKYHSTLQTVGRTWAAKANELTREFTREDISAAFNEIQGDRLATEGTSIRASQDALHKLVKGIFSPDPDTNILTANGVTPAQMNSLFDKFGIKVKPFEDGMNFQDWREWPVDDPIDLMTRLQAAAGAAITDNLLGADLSRRFGSKTAGAGMVKIKPGKGSILARHLDPESYFPRETAQQFSVLDEFMKEMRKPSSSSKALSLYDTVLHAYKSGLTIYRPGHHVRNMVGDMWLSFMDGVTSPVPYKWAAEIMYQNRGRYHDIDNLDEVMRSFGKDPTTSTATTTILSTKIGGKATPLTSGQIYDMAYKQGILPDYRTIEDIQFAGDKSAALHLPGPLKGKAHKAASSFSEGRDHYARIAHFTDILNKGSFKSLDDAAEQAGRRVRKWHPDGSDLTNFESKVMRRSFLFYSWIRKAIPLVAESMVMRPGRAMVYPKAMYALAESMGVNPDSFGDPFPEDQLFPSWIADSVTGPQFEFGPNNDHYWGINPGVPMADVMNDYTQSPGQSLRTILGSATPALKWPVELATGQDLRTGVPITDTSDYVDRQIPGVNSVANITNMSPSSLFTQSTGEGLGDSPEQVQAAQQKNPPGDKIAFLNYLSGLGLIDMSKPSYQKQAQIEQGRRGR